MEYGYWQFTTIHNKEARIYMSILTFVFSITQWILCQLWVNNCQFLLLFHFEISTFPDNKTQALEIQTL